MKRLGLLETTLGIQVVLITGLLWALRPQGGQALEGDVSYPSPRYPSYAVKPKTIEEVMPFARLAVRQTGGRSPLGLVREGQTVLLVAQPNNSDLLIEAIKKAYAERGVKAEVVFESDLVGVKREDAAMYLNSGPYASGERGYMEARFWIDQRFPDRDKPKEWLKAHDAKLYGLLYPTMKLPPQVLEGGRKMTLENIARGIIAYLDKHREVNALFWATGGRTNHRKRLGKYQNKFYGNFIYGQQYNLVSKVPEFPSDVWRLLEERAVEALTFVDRAQVNDPEGTRFSFDVSEKLADVWSRGAYQQGHLYMLPVQATGRFPYSIIDYPAFTSTYLPPMVVLADGVFAGHVNHHGVFPCIKVTVQKGYISKVEGGGAYGDAWRDFLQYPKINELKWPLYSDDPNYAAKGGYFWLYEAGLGTNPKFFNTSKDPGQRNRGGTVHWGFGLRVEHGPKGPYMPKEWSDFTKSNDLPDDHWWHIHNYFLTYQVRIKGTNKWIKLLDRGVLSALSNPEVRALASRYGNPDQLLANDFNPDVPGINSPGSYEEFCKDPWSHYRRIFEQVDAGSYRYLYPTKTKQ